MSNHSSLNSWEAQVRKGILEFIVLHELSKQPSYGYDLLPKVQNHKGMAISESAIYLSLNRLARDKFIIAKNIKSASGPPRKQYKLTALGVIKLDKMKKFTRNLAQSLLENI